VIAEVVGAVSGDDTTDESSDKAESDGDDKPRRRGWWAIGR